MALVECPDCAAKVSDVAPACPNCGRPMAPTPDMRIASGPKRSRIQRTLSATLIVALAAAATIWFIPGFELGAELQARCQVNGLGDGSCQFTNTGWSPGSQCLVVKLVNPGGASDSSGPVCSGRISPTDSLERSVSIALDNCRQFDACSLEISDIHEVKGPEKKRPEESPKAVPANSGDATRQALLAGANAGVDAAADSSTAPTDGQASITCNSIKALLLPEKLAISGQDVPYPVVRDELLAKGWIPAGDPEAGEDIGAADFKAAGYAEFEGCAADRPVCRVSFTLNQLRLAVLLAVDESQPSTYSVSAGDYQLEGCE